MVLPGELDIYKQLSATSPYGFNQMYMSPRIQSDMAMWGQRPITQTQQAPWWQRPLSAYAQMQGAFLAPTMAAMEMAQVPFEYLKEYVGRPWAAGVTAPIYGREPEVQRQYLEAITPAIEQFQERPSPLTAMQLWGEAIHKPFYPGGVMREPYAEWEAPKYVKGALETIPELAMIGAISAPIGAIPIKGVPISTWEAKFLGKIFGPIQRRVGAKYFDWRKGWKKSPAYKYAKPGTTEHKLLHRIWEIQQRFPDKPEMAWQDFQAVKANPNLSKLLYEKFPNIFSYNVTEQQFANWMGFSGAKPPAEMMAFVRGPVAGGLPRAVTAQQLPAGSMLIRDLSSAQLKSVGIRQLINSLSKLKLRKIPLEYKTAISDILKGFDLKFRTAKTLNKQAALRSYINYMEETGASADIPPELIDEARKMKLGDMTVSQVEELYNHIAGVVNQGRLKNKLIKIQAQRRVNDAVDDLIASLGPIPEEPAIIGRASLERGLRARLMEAAGNFTNRGWRTERILLRIDGFEENGPFMRTFWNTVDGAWTQKLIGRTTLTEELINLLKVNRLDVSKLAHQKIIVQGMPISRADAIGIYGMSNNKANMLHVRYGNLRDIKGEEAKDAALEEIRAALTPEEMRVANWFRELYNNRGRAEALSAVRTQVEGRPMTIEEDYWPIYLRREPELMDVSVEKQLAREEIFRFTARWPSSRIAKGFLSERTRQAIQPIELDPFTTFLRHIDITEHYKAFAPIIRDLQLIINNPKFKRSFIAKRGRAEFNVLNQWLKDVAQTDPMAVRSWGEALMRQFRGNAVIAFLGANLTAGFKQLPSFITGVSELGFMPSAKGLFGYLRHPKAVRRIMKQYAPQVYHRTFEREIAEMRAMRGAKLGKLTFRQVATLMMVMLDRLAVDSLWWGAFNKHLEAGATMEEAGKLAQRLILRTQPAFTVKDVPEFWRSGEVMKMFTIFTNQLNQYANLIRFDWWGKWRAGKISTAEFIKKVIVGFILPSLIIGMITRSRPPKNAKEFALDIGAQSLATIPIFGSWLSGGLRGFQPSGIVSAEIMEAAQRFMFNLSKGNWNALIKTAPEIAALIAGFPYSQPRRTIEAIMRLSQGNSDDLLELIWGQYTRRRAQPPEPKPKRIYQQPQQPSLGRAYPTLGESYPPLGEAYPSLGEAYGLFPR